MWKRRISVKNGDSYDRTNQSSPGNLRFFIQILRFHIEFIKKRIKCTKKRRFYKPIYFVSPCYMLHVCMVFAKFIINMYINRFEWWLRCLFLNIMQAIIVTVITKKVRNFLNLGVRFEVRNFRLVLVRSEFLKCLSEDMLWCLQIILNYCTLHSKAQSEYWERRF